MKASGGRRPQELMWLVRSVRRRLPEGGTLPEGVWQARHRGIVVLLWLHVPGIFLFGLTVGPSLAHLLLEVLPLAVVAALATSYRNCRRPTTILTSLGLMTASGELVHLSGGMIEAHFHFFVMVGVVVLYQDWWPFLVAVGYVVLHHGVMGSFASESVFNHPAALRSPWRWAGIHGAMILAMSIVGIVAWRLNEALHRTALEREHQLAEAQRLARVGSWEWDLTASRLDWSDEMFRIVGFEPRQVQPTLGLLFERVHEDDRAPLGEVIEQAIADGAPILIDFRLRRPDGEIAWIQGRGQVLRDEAGNAVKMRGTGQDITEAKHAEEALAQARDEALEASRMKSAFLANMSHEIRTPMNGVIGLTDLLAQSELDDVQLRYAEGIRSAGESLLAIIDDILDFSKVEAGKLELERVEFDVCQLVEEGTALLAEPARAKGIELVTACHPSLPRMLQGDALRLRQVVVNLVGNAVKFTHDGEVVVRACLLHDQGEEVVLRVEVTDTGIGLDAEQQTRLFQPFVQADASTTRRYGGTGLGLALARRLVELMDGNIGVESAPGVGSTFWFTVRLDKAVVTPLVSPVEAHVLAGVRVLVVDDNASSRVIVEQQVKSWDMRPVLAESGRQALELLRAAATAGEPFDMAVLDMDMPGWSGLELAEAVTADPALSGLPLVLLTSAAGVDRDRRQDAGIHVSLAKPLRQSAFYDALVKAMSQRSTQSHRRPPAAPATEVVQDASIGSILVVEDNAINQTVAAGTLTKLGYRFDLAGNGLEALDALAGKEYSAVLMDCQMPEMDGFQATEEIRRREADGRRTPIIAMTASAMEGDRERCLASGMDDYLAKPVRFEEVAAKLRRWVGGAGDALPEKLGAPETGVLDEEQLETLREVSTATGNADLLRRLVDEFTGNAIARMEQLRDAVSRSDAPLLESAAHGLKGSSSTMGAARVAAACAVLESAGRKGELDGVEPQLQRVERELRLATDALHTECCAGRS